LKIGGVPIGVGVAIGDCGTDVGVGSGDGLELVGLRLRSPTISDTANAISASMLNRLPTNLRRLFICRFLSHRFLSTLFAGGGYAQRPAFQPPLTRWFDLTSSRRSAVGCNRLLGGMKLRGGSLSTCKRAQNTYLTKSKSKCFASLAVT
jgi:hypothetical protein